MTIMAM
ncbi:hypothetical protein LINPERHAP1_LOCUS36352 [Linum perenne]